MKVVELLEQRRQNWSELERLCEQIERRSKRSLGPESIHRFAHLYRAACADLALADSYQLPVNTIAYLHQLVGRAHNQLYRTRKFNFRGWAFEMIYVLPPRLFRDNSLRLAFVLFWSIFLASMALAYNSPKYTEDVLGKEMVSGLEQMYAEPLSGRDPQQSGMAAGFYQQHNTSIGLKCFAAGLVLGVGGLFELIFNAGFLGAAFGHMAQAPQRANFYEFVTAHGPFELTAIVLSAAAGMRLGFSLIDTRGLSRAASLRQAGHEAKATVSAAIILFGLAAVIEGFVSPSAAPYWVKATVAAVSSALLMFYFVFLGLQPNADIRN
jgi:uncharacterized membrane protein SpoIIM required for sporulation